VVAAIDLRDSADSVGRLAERMDLLGAVLGGDWDDDDELGAAVLAGTTDRWGGELREAADAVDHDLVITGFDPGHRDADTAGDIVGALRSVIDDAIADGVPIECVFIEPGIAGAEAPIGLLDADRAPTPSSAAFLDT
jgi:hypothetical protein